MDRLVDRPAAGSIGFLLVGLTCLGGWIDARDAGRRDPLSLAGALLALGGFALVMHRLGGLP